METTVITGAMIRRMILAASEALTKHKEEIDALKVFPVPDGDTGTNMNLKIIEEAKDTYRRGYGEVTGTIKDNVVWKVGIAQSSKQNQNDPK